MVITVNVPVSVSADDMKRPDWPHLREALIGHAIDCLRGMLDHQVKALKEHEARIVEKL